MIKKITFNEDYICFLKKQNFTFNPITLLVGDQGCGKSTLLRILKDVAERGGDYKSFTSEFDDSIQEKTFLFDCEKDNPRTSRPNPDSSNSMLFAATSQFRSHGEVLLPLMKTLSDCENTIIMLDEPETSLSIRSLYLMVEIFKGCLSRNNQIFLATHNPVFMEAFSDSILSLEHNKYLTYRKFLNSQKSSSNFKDKRDDRIIKKEKCKLGIKCVCASDIGRYDNKCFHYIDRDGKSGNQRDMFKKLVTIHQLLKLKPSES